MLLDHNQNTIRNSSKDIVTHAQNYLSTYKCKIAYNENTYRSPLLYINRNLYLPNIITFNLVISVSIPICFCSATYHIG